MVTRYVIFNGPPKSGKSTAAQMLVTFLRDKQLLVSSESFVGPMKHFIATLLAEQYHKMNKEAPVPELHGRSVRQFLIDLSENYMKIQYGPDIFGRMLYYRSLRNTPPPDFVVIDDSGFDAEFDAIGEPIHRFLVRLSRPDCSYINDSRGYLSEPDFYMSNDGDLDALRGNVYALSTQLIMVYRGEMEKRI